MFKIRLSGTSDFLSKDIDRATAGKECTFIKDWNNPSTLMFYKLAKRQRVPSMQFGKLKGSVLQ